MPFRFLDRKDFETWAPLEIQTKYARMRIGYNLRKVTESHPVDVPELGLILTICGNIATVAGNPIPKLVSKRNVVTGTRVLGRVVTSFFRGPIPRSKGGKK